MFTRLLEVSDKRPDRFADIAKQLFGQMKTGGDFNLESIE